MKEFSVALRMFLVLTVLTGVVYPLLVTGTAQAAFPSQANGSLIREDNKVVGSSLIGQQFDDPEYFWGRPSATSPKPYNGSSSSGSNLGPTNPDLLAQIEARISALRMADPGNTQPIPTDLVTASGSGLDPHISVAAAKFQVNRVARLRGVSVDEIHALVRAHTQHPSLGIIGEPVVNVLKLNLALDKY